MKIVLVEDQALFRDFLAVLVRDRLGHEVVGEAANGEQALDLIRSTLPDLIILDILIPRLSGIRVAQTISKELPSTRILALSSALDAKTVHQVHRLGLNGFVDKNEASKEVLIKAIDGIERSSRFFSDSVRRAIRRLQTDPVAFQKILSPREQEVLTLVGGGLSDEEIGMELELTPQSAQSYRKTLLRKLEVHSTPELINYAHENGFWKAAFTRMDLQDGYHIRESSK